MNIFEIKNRLALLRNRIEALQEESESLVKSRAEEIWRTKRNSAEFLFGFEQEVCPVRWRKK